MNNNFVKIHVRFREPGDGPRGESPWAEPVDANDGGGVFRLQNDLAFTPLRHGDLVRCELDADSLYQVVEVISVVPGVLFGFEHPKGMRESVAAILDAKKAEGYEVNWPFDGFVEIFMEGEDAGSRIVATSGVPSTWVHVEYLEAQHRLEEACKDIDFELNMTPRFSDEPVDYWAPDDDAWTELGVDHPDLLAVIQSLASKDPRVLATIQAGHHRDVLTYMERLSTPDPRDLPKLDRPLLVDPVDAD